ncbi:MAG: glycosyltransferase family 1 protein [Cytophagaceae bacterium]|nr:MAG: glycosyltransferase family 1 protein [Cytophagaceae bacterium]
MGLKILVLSHRFFPAIGGIEVNSEIYARAFAAAGHQVRLLTWSTTEADTAFPFIVIRNPSKWLLFREHAWADIVFENNPCVRLGWPALFFRRPAVISLNTSLSDSAGVAWLKRIWLQRADTIIAVSEAVRRQNWPAASVISNPYREDAFRLIPEVARRGDFVFLGRLVSQKGAHQAIAAFKQLLERLAQAAPTHAKPTLTIIGDGPERGQLTQLVATLQLSTRVRFTGFMHGEALVRQLNQHQFLVVPSVYGEAFGNVVLEGMACGCLPLVSDSDGLPDAVGQAGLVFQRDNANSLADTMWRILHDAALAAQLRQAAPAHLASHQSAIVSRRYLRVLEAAAEGSK